MEFIAAILVIVVLCIILGVSTGVMIAAALALVVLIIVFVAAFFTVSLVRLLLSEKAEAKFSRIDKRPNGKFRVAYYMVNGQEYPNISPRRECSAASFTKQAGSIPCGSTEAADSYSTGSPAPLLRQALFRG